MLATFTKKMYALLSGGLVSLALFSKNAYAHCPLCTAAVGTVAVSAGAFGIDSSVVGIFVGAFAVSTGLWAGRKIKTAYVPYQTATLAILSFLLTMIPVEAVVPDDLYLPVLYFGAPGTLFNRVYWPSKILFGGLIGGGLTIASLYLHEFLKKRNGGKVYFQFQGVILTLGLLVFSAVALFLAMG